MAIKQFLGAFFQSYKNTFGQKAENAYQEYRAKGGKISKRTLIRDMRMAYARQGIVPAHYLQFRFYEKTNREKAQYMSLKRERALFMNSPENHFPKGKYDRYLLFQPYFRREITAVFFTGDEQAHYAEFCGRHAEFMVKPIIGTKGHGVEKLRFAEAPFLKELEAYSDGGCLLEELICQGEEMARFHPSSINTVRFVSAMSPEEKYTALFALLRTGKGGSVVDNVGSGGLIAQIDIVTGRVVTDGLYGDVYFAAHPDTGVVFQNAQIPRWEELCALVHQIHSTIPDQCLIGWDFAWTDKHEWDLVEANPMPSFISYQTLANRGICPMLREAGLLQ